MAGASLVNQNEDDLNKQELNNKYPQQMIELLSSFSRLDTLLEQAIKSISSNYGTDMLADSFRGMYVGREEIDHLLERGPLATIFNHNEYEVTHLGYFPNEHSKLAKLKRAFNLSNFDIDLIIIALAPQVDRRYERIYAYLQDHVSRYWPTIDLALHLLCKDAVTRLRRRTHFDASAPLIHNNLIHMIPESDPNHTSLLALGFKLDNQIVNYLLHHQDLDSRIAPFCYKIHPENVKNQPYLLNKDDQLKVKIGSFEQDNKRPLRLYFHGPKGVGKRQAAISLLNEKKRRLLIVDLSLVIINYQVNFPEFLRLVFHHARLYNMVPYFDELDGIWQDKYLLLQKQLYESLSNYSRITFLAGAQPWIPNSKNPLGIMNIPIPFPDFDKRKDYWQSALSNIDISLDQSVLDNLSNQFQFTQQQIAEATYAALNYARWRYTKENHRLKSDQATDKLQIDDLFTASRAQSGHEIASLAQRIQPRYKWKDIILPIDQLDVLKAICNQSKQSHIVFSQWGFGRKLSQSKGLNVLFSGPPGTGKTMAAEVVANELQIDLFKIDLSRVISKYIGETEKNLDRIFTAAENANVILFFDEADALFGKRSEVRDSHDRYSNIEISYLLQKMEAHQGMSILATNLRKNMDEAFTRRLRFIVEFLFPDEDQRRQIWKVIFPKQAPLNHDIDFHKLAREIKLAGGNIRNIALNAAFYAAEHGTVISMHHLFQAARREYQKLGRTWDDVPWQMNGTSKASRL